MTGKAAKILFLVNQSSKIVLTCMDLSIGGRAWRGSKPTYESPWKLDFYGRFWLGGITRNRIFGITRKAVKILFLLNRQSKTAPTCTDVSIGGRDWRGRKPTYKMPWKLDFCGRFQWKGSVMWSRFFCDDGEGVNTLFLLYCRSKIVPTCTDLFIGGRAWRGRNPTYKMPWKLDFCGRFQWKGSVMRSRFFWDDGEGVKILFLLNCRSKIVPTCTDLSIGCRAWRGSKLTCKILKIRLLRTVLVISTIRTGLSGFLWIIRPNNFSTCHAS